ncbi:hypothetical protein [Moorena sp. SIO3B2]|uniref:hypothetical protein n=1 Tax=Moorena sp. SIO3B2 TaxID=2607827 RepID=UPI002579A39F|nr:hypothetical protein [Moorena sp. SIO3B2]
MFTTPSLSRAQFNPCSLLPAPCSLLPAPCSLLPAPCSLLPKTQDFVPHPIEKYYKSC